MTTSDPDSSDTPCRTCGDPIPTLRQALGYYECLVCGEARAREVKHCAIPLSKSNYIYVSPRSRETLAQLNPKRTT